VENGGGLIVIHSGTVAGENTDMLDNLIGCRFISHPNPVRVTVAPVKPHPVTEGVSMFSETDEHYKILVLQDDMEIIAASYSPAQGDPDKYESDSYFNSGECLYPSVLVRKQGKGRICVITPGHFVSVWLNENFKKLLTNAIKWSAKR
jgi:type 1 glutamine amidotransferase